MRYLLSHRRRKDCSSIAVCHTVTAVTPERAAERTLNVCPRRSYIRALSSLFSLSKYRLKVAEGKEETDWKDVVIN